MRTIGHRTKYMPGINKFDPNQTENKITMALDVVTLNIMCSYIITDNKNIRRGHLMNFKTMIESLDENCYINDLDKLNKINFIKRGLEGRINYNIKSNDILMKHITGSISGDMIDISNVEMLTNDEVNWTHEMVSESLKFATIEADIDKLIDVASRFKAAEYGNRSQIVREYENVINDAKTKLRRLTSQSANDVIFTLKEGPFEESIRDFHNQLSDPSNKLNLGMQGLNAMTGGGVESGRCYMFFGLPGEGKSTVLLNLAYHIKKYNKHYKTKDPTKTPCVVFFTMENNVRETIERLFAIACNNNQDLTDYTVEEVINMLRTEGELYISDESPIDIIIKYKPDRSVDTSYLYTLVEDLEDEGYEAICFVQDYVKRIRSTDKIYDLRLELGAVVNEFKTFASEKNIPFISASQLNRDASKHIDDARKNNKADLVRLMGRSNIGESMLMLENVDCSFLIAPEYDDKGGKVMGMQRVKIRYKAPYLDNVYFPFTKGNDIRFVEDFDLDTPTYRTTMKEEKNNGNLVMSNYHGEAIPVIDDDFEEISKKFEDVLFGKGDDKGISQCVAANIPTVEPVFYTYMINPISISPISMIN